MAHADIIIYGVIAVALLARLWSVFGRRNDEDRPRPNPFAAPAPGLSDEGDTVVRPRAGNAQAPAFTPLLTAPLSLAGALERVSEADPGFDEKQFLQDAKGIFTAVVGAFAKGDLTSVEAKLGPAVLPHFQAAITARQKAGETLENKINRIREAEVTAADVTDNRIVVTTRFVSEQENILRDASGKILSGAAGKPEEITDVWVFARDIKTQNWQVAETKS
jgi:predicted lipid-binding transport protein (Tim44 family)